MIAILGAIAAASVLQTALNQRVAGAPGTGIAVGIIDHGKQSMYFAGSDGKGRPVDRNTLFEIGSVTKTFTATALASMVLSNQVRLDAPISEFLPPGVRAPSKDGKQITLLDLAEQRSGLPRLPSNLNGSMDDPYADYGNEQMYAFLNGYTLTRDPGAQYEYSNYAIGLLGQLLANRAKTTYPELVRRKVFEPLGMSETTFVLTGVPDPPELALGHDSAGEGATTWHSQAIAPAGGIASSLDDMLKYLRCNMGEGPIAHACLSAQKPRAPGEPGHEIGLVWNVNSTTGTISHGGDTNGFHAFVAISHDHQTGVVVLGNGPLVEDIATHVIAPSYPIDACPATVPAAKTDAASYGGVYCNASIGATFTVEPSRDPDNLTIALLPQPAFEYKRVDADTYFFARAGAMIRFVREGRGISGLWLFQGEAIIPFTRLDVRGAPVVAQLSSPFPKAIDLGAPVLQQYVGTYTVDGGTFTITLRNDTLYVQLTGQPAIPAYASAKDEFFSRDVWAQITFGRNASGAVTSLTLHQNGHDVTARRTSP
ncbi:MAG: serine hydrolase [Candidatus Cybelea sp.]